MAHNHYEYFDVNKSGKVLLRCIIYRVFDVGCLVAERMVVL